MKKVALVLCNDMHMDIANANTILNHITKSKDYEVVCDYTIADVIVILTCAFGPNKMYSMRVIADVRLNAMPNARVIVTGCLTKIAGDELKGIPNVEVKTFEEIINLFNVKCQINRIIPQNKVIISKGCLHKCSYCVYPKIEPSYHSRPIEEILDEIGQMYEEESTIYITGAQETSDYGVDLYGSRKFAELMEKILEKYPECQYVIGWFHPAGLTDEVMTILTKNKNITEIMLHIQHVSDKILLDMNRGTPFKNIETKIRKLKELRPDLAISTEVIVGFPGETEKQFEELIKFLNKGYFSDIGVASYEKVTGTKAATLPNQIETSEKERRLEFIKSMFSATCYPADEHSSNSIIDEYLKSRCMLQKLPKNIFKPEKRQKYELIAGTDVTEKMNFDIHFAYIFRQISEARSEFEQKCCKEKLKFYTDETKKICYEIICKGNFKPALKERAKKLLL